MFDPIHFKRDHYATQSFAVPSSYLKVYSSQPCLQKLNVTVAENAVFLQVFNYSHLCSITYFNNTADVRLLIRSLLPYSMAHTFSGVHVHVGPLWL